MKKKIKIFLGGYVNYLNAQNINCRALSDYLNRDKFEVSTMLFPIQNAADFERKPDVKYIQLHRPVRLSMYFTYLRGIASADVAFLPKGEIDDFCRFVAKLFRTKVFTTLEGLIDDDSLVYLNATEKGRHQYIEHFTKYEPNLFAITKFISIDVAKRRGYNFADEILYLGVDGKIFYNPDKVVTTLKNVVFIGNLPIGKKVDEFLNVASIYPDVQFHIVGGNQLKDCTIEEYIASNELKNVTYHGRLDHSHLSKLLQSMDLMYFPSRSEGFPKVHLETACAGVPTMCYPDYGAAEWIDSWENGIIVNDKEEARSAVQKLIDNPDLLRQLSQGAVELGKSFDWQKLVSTWERVIERIYNE
jgi:glycosyltransferase involved in cell wall biosynthesis